MKKAIIIYRSKTGITRGLGENISLFLEEHDIVTEIMTLNEARDISFQNYDYVFLGCWTSGLFLFFQKPEKSWVEFAKKIPRLDCAKTILFTTYKVRTGSMFRNMRKHLLLSGSLKNMIEIASRNENLPEKYRNELCNLIKDE